MEIRNLIRLLMAGILWVALCFSPAGAQKQPLNQETANLNVLFVGFEDDRLEMVSVYSINHQDQMQSGAIFFPVQALVPDAHLSFREYYQNYGLEPLRQAVEDNLNIKIAYHVTIRNSIMEEVERLIGPITIREERVDLSRIFTMPPTPQDGLILGELVQRLTKPEVYFWRLPRLVLTAHRHITTDFPLTAENLWLHYRIASQIPTDQIKKVILSAYPQIGEGKISWQLSTKELEKVVYDITQ